MKPLEILLIGPGAVGICFAGRLAYGGAKVAVVARRDREIIARSGYRIETDAGSNSFVPAMVLQSAAEYPGRPDWIIAATKALPEIDLPRLIGGAVRSKQTRLLLIQNGIFTEEPVAAAFPDQPLYCGVALIGAARTAPGVVRASSNGRLIFGRWRDREPEEEARLLAEIMSRMPGTEPSTAVTDICFQRWKKLLWNGVYNPLGVVAGGRDTAYLAHTPEMVKLSRRMMAEIAAAAALDGITLTPAMAEEYIAYTRSRPPYKTSMLLDYEAGRPMELDALLGNPIRFARSHGLELPHLETVLTLLRRLEARNRAG